MSTEPPHTYSDTQVKHLEANTDGKFHNEIGRGFL